MLDRIFRLAENRTSVRTELLAGLTTFLTMAYIIFVQPAVLSGKMFGIDTGMDFHAVTAATCISAAIASAIMGFYARYPIAQAPGMGENFFFVFSAIPAAAAAGFESPWRVALGVVMISGILFMLVSLVGLREALINAISPSMKNGIAVGIGLFIAFIGLRNAQVILPSPGTAVKLNPHFNSPDVIVFFVGLVTAATLHARRVRGSIMWGIAASTTMAIAMKLGGGAAPGSLLATSFVLSTDVIAAPPSLEPTLFKADIGHALSPAMWPFILIFLFMVLFDTIGTLVGVCEQGGFLVDNKLPRARRALLSDAIGTVVGAAAGTSTVTSYIESAAGIEAGGRTGLTSVVVAIFFLLALFFSPLIAMIGSYAPITAPALVLVGAMMIQNVRKIDWDDHTESIPAFLIMIGIPLSYSIADGLALGFIAYPVIKVLSGRGRDAGWLVYGMALVLVLYFVFVRGKLG